MQFASAAGYRSNVYLKSSESIYYFQVANKPTAFGIDRKATMASTIGSSTKRGYQQVRVAVEEYLREHDLQPGDRLPTEAEFCSLLGWSRPTITRALNDMAREGVLERAQGRGTFVAQRTVENRSFYIMVSTPWTQHSSYIGPLFTGIRQEAAKHSCNVMYYSDSPVPSVDTVMEQGVDGVLAVAPWLDNLSGIQQLREAKIPVVGLAARSRIDHLPIVCTDNYGGVYRAVKYLYGLGHRRIAFVSDSISTSDVLDRLLGMQNALAEECCGMDPAYLLMTLGDIDQSYLEYWFDNLSSPPTAMLFSIKMAVSVLSLLAKKHVSVPDDISLIVTDDPVSEFGLGPTLACIQQPVLEMGRRGTEKLLDIINGQDSGGQEVIPTELIIRDSVLPVREYRESLVEYPLSPGGRG